MEETVIDPMVTAAAAAGRGLTADQVLKRTQDGQVNTPVDSKQSTLADIVRENVCTYFNLIFLIIAVCLCLVGEFRGLTFLPVVISNTLIGIVQEWRSRKLLDEMRLVNAPKIRVIRDGKEEEIPSSELVLDDLVIWEAGSQISADARVDEGEVLVNEALLTGESDEILKRPGDTLMSGSFVVSGKCFATLTGVGENAYVSKLTLEAKQYKKEERSEMIRSLDRLVRIVGILILPIAAVLFWQQFHVNKETLRMSVSGTVAAILGMIPEGLYLLASVAMAVSAFRLALNKVLVQNMKSIETLARADVLCVDKTGTITENEMSVRRFVPLQSSGAALTEEEKGEAAQEDLLIEEMMNDGIDPEEDAGQQALSAGTGDAEEKISLWLGDFAAAMPSDNDTARAMKAFFVKGSGAKPKQVYGFSSVHKYSAVVFEDRILVLGAPEYVLREGYENYRERIEAYASLGYRGIVFGEAGSDPGGEALTESVRPLALVLLRNPVRESAPDTFRYFRQQQVQIRVISGDNPRTASQAAREAGIDGAGSFIDVTGLSDEELKEAADTYTVFGRVSPEQKRMLIRYMKEAGHTVAMTGDGVNDVLALREADCSIAMASGSDAAAHAAQMVLIDSDFARMPSVVAEGRRVVNNIERTASLFLVKNIFSLLLSVLSIVFFLRYPLAPSQISLISAFTIGIPAFVMSLENNTDPIRGHFLKNVFYRALPAGLTDFIIISALVLFCQEFRVSAVDTSTSCTILLAIVGIMILYRIASPMTILHALLWIAMIGGILFSMYFFPHIFSLRVPSRRSAMLLILFAGLTEPLLRYLSLLLIKLSQLRDKLQEQWKTRKERPTW